MAKCALWTWGHRPECTLFLGSSTSVHNFFGGLFMSVHIFFMPVIQFVSRVNTLVYGWLVYTVLSCPPALKFRILVPRSGSWRACRRGGGENPFPLNARDAAAAATAAAAAAAVEVLAGGGGS